MPIYLSPGVYVEEVPSGSAPIAGVSTSTAGFIGAIACQRILLGTLAGGLEVTRHAAHRIIERLAEGAPEGFGVVFDAFRKSLEAQIAAMDNMNKVGAQIQGITDSNLLAIKRVVETGAAAPVAAKRKAA